MIKLLRNIIIIAMCLEFITRNTWFFFTASLYFSGESLQRVFYTVVITIFSRYVKGIKWLFRVSCMAFGLALLDLYDEAFCKPASIELAEYKIAIVIVAFCCIGLTGLRFILFYLMFNSFILLNHNTNVRE